MDQTPIHTDKELFTLIAGGDEAAFEQLFRLYVPQLQRLIYPIVHSETVVKDIAQEVFLSIWLGRDRLSDIDEPKRWIFRIAYNQSFRYLKRQSLLEKARVDMGFDAETDISHDTEHAINVSEVSRLISQAIRELPAQGRKIFEMNRVSGMKPAEIAESLQISVQGVRNSLTRSGKFIREYLAAQGIEIPLILLVFFSR